VAAIARTANGNFRTQHIQPGQAFQLIPDQRNIKWLLENFLKNLFWGIA
jgi:hypothetical protein